MKNRKMLCKIVVVVTVKWEDGEKVCFIRENVLKSGIMYLPSLVVQFGNFH